MSRYLAILCLSLPLFATTADAALGAEGAWIKDDKGCEHWNEAPKAGETVTWTGDCREGKAEARPSRLAGAAYTATEVDRRPGSTPGGKQGSLPTSLHP